MRTTVILALGLAAAGAPGVLAAPAATQDQADRLKAVFERYLGHPAAGQSGSVTVVPEGQSYRTTIDIRQLMRPLDGFGFSMEPATQSMILTPNDDGTWRVTSDAMAPIVMHVKDQTMTMQTSSYRFDGTYDPKLGVFTDQSTTQDGSSVDQEAPSTTQHRRSGHSVLTEKAVPAEANTATADVHYGLTDTTAQIVMRPPAAKSSDEVAPATPPVEFSYAVPSSALDLHIDKLPALKLLDLWAFLVAHPDREALKASQDDLRVLVKAALPLMGGLKESGSAQGLTVKTQLGDFAARSFGGSLDIVDPAGTGKVVSTLTIDGLSVPTATLPAWSTGFLPTSIDLRPTVTGLHIDEATRVLVDDFDVKDGLTPEQSTAIGHVAWPGDGKLVLAPSRITSGLLDIRFEGEATIGPTPVGRVTVTATGLDKAIATLQDAASADPTAGQALTGLVTAKNLAKPNPDGSLVWVIEASGNAVTVNGAPLK